MIETLGMLNGKGLGQGRWRIGLAGSIQVKSRGLSKRTDQAQKKAPVPVHPVQSKKVRKYPGNDITQTDPTTKTANPRPSIIKNQT